MGFNDEFRKRTKEFSLNAIKLYQSLPKTEEARIMGKQFLRSATSLGSNFRAATRARSRAEFFSKLSIVIEEADETSFWMELMSDAKIIPNKKLDELMRECLELTKVFSSSRRTIRKNDSNDS